MDFELQNVMDWYDENKEWFLIPIIIASAVVLIGFVLMLITGKDVNVVLNFFFFVFCHFYFLSGVNFLQAIGSVISQSTQLILSII